MGLGNGSGTAKAGGCSVGRSRRSAGGKDGIGVSGSVLGSASFRRSEALRDCGLASKHAAATATSKSTPPGNRLGVESGVLGRESLVRSASATVLHCTVYGPYFYCSLLYTSIYSPSRLL